MVRAYSHVCVAKSCYNTRLTHPEKGFFGFPSDAVLCSKWLVNCQRKDLPVNAVLRSNGYYKLCADHFEDKWFTDGTRTLLKRALNPEPTIFIDNRKSLVPKNCQSSQPVEIDLPSKPQSEVESDENTEYLECVIDPQALMVQSQPSISFDSVQIVKKPVYEPETISQLLVNLEPQSELYQLREMCRFCMNKRLPSTEPSLDLFAETEEAGELRQICAVILPYKVRVWDVLPHRVCEQCVTDLQTCHRLMQQFKATDRYLRAIAKYSLYVDLEEDSSSESGSVKSTEEEDCKPIPKNALVMQRKHFNLEDISETINSESSVDMTVDNVPSDALELPEEPVDVENVENLPEISQPEIMSQTLDEEEENDKVELVCQNVVFVPSNLPQDIERLLSYFTPDEPEEINTVNETRLETSERTDRDILQLNDDVMEDISEEILRMAERTEEPDLTVSYKCLQCYKVFPGYDTLVDHTLSVHDIPKSRYPSTECLLETDTPTEQQAQPKPKPPLNIKCAHCGEQFVVKAEFMQHMKDNHTFKCSICDKVWYSQERLDKHFEANHNLRVDCSICGKVCKNVVSRRLHERTHQEQGHVCWICGAVLKSKAGMRIHMELHSEKYFTCNVCDRSFKTSRAMKQHRKRTHVDPADINKKVFQCEVCRKFFDCPSSLQKHYMTHSNVRNHVCSHCGMAFKYMEGLTRHDQRRINEGLCPSSKRKKGPRGLIPTKKQKIKEPTLPCTVCGRKFVKARNVERHMKLHLCNGDPEVIQTLLDEPEMYKCDICGKLLYSKTYYQNHVNRGHHGDPKPFKCGFCDYSAASQILMVLHERNHTGERPFKCELCGKTFRTKKTLLQHETVHTDERPHQCTSCDKTFKSRFRLLEHTLVHEDVSAIRPFSCPHCQRQFTSKGHLSLHHLKVHTQQRVDLVNKQIETAGKDKRFKCQVCGMVFKNQDYRQRHMRRIHRGAKHVRATREEDDVQAVQYIECNVVEQYEQEQYSAAEDNMAVQYVTIVKSEQEEPFLNMPTVEYILP